MEGYLAGGGLTGILPGVEDLPVRRPGGIGGGILVDAVPAIGIAIPKTGGGGFGYPPGDDGGLFTGNAWLASVENTLTPNGSMTTEDGITAVVAIPAVGCTSGCGVDTLVGGALNGGMRFPAVVP